MAFFYKHQRDSHVKRVHLKIKDTVCDHCGSIFFGNKDLREHINYVHNEAKVKHPCDDCGKEFRQKGDLTRHVRTVHWKIRNIPMEAKCDDCGKEFAFKSEAKRHMRMVHLKDMKTGEPIERKMCSECGKTFKADRDLLVHQKEIHLNIRDHKCDECDLAFA